MSRKIFTAKSCSTLLLILTLTVATGCKVKKDESNDDMLLFLLTSTPTMSVEAEKVYDPKMPGNPKLTINYTAGPAGKDFGMTVKIVDNVSGAEVRTILDKLAITGGSKQTTDWDGKNNSGKFVDPGVYKIVAESDSATLGVTTAEQLVTVMRIGIAGIQFTENGAANPEYQIMYHMRNSTKYVYYPIPDNQPECAIGPNQGDIADLDFNTGTPRPILAPWTNLSSPPQDATDPASVEDDNYNLPICYKKGSTPKFTVTLGTDGVSNTSPGTIVTCNFPSAEFPVRIVETSSTPVAGGSNENISPGDSVTFTCNSPLSGGVQKNVLVLTFQFEYKDGATWHRVPGEIITTHTVYTIHDTPTFTDAPGTVAPFLPWVWCLEKITFWANNATTENAVMNEIVTGVNSKMGIQYDTAMGASAYVSWVSAEQEYYMEMSNFIQAYDASNLSRVNCLDCAHLVMSLSNMVGIGHEYVLIYPINYPSQVAIYLNYMIPIGWDWMIPFEGAFSYHAVNSNDYAASISDACCVLDNDGDPGPYSSSTTHTPILPVQMNSITYMQLLCRTPITGEVADTGDSPLR